ncbi:MAG: protein kinase [Synechococcales bacterium]|nr:protein kinase [Synechococcales bacterium]
MICCLNPQCSQPLNPDSATVCRTCGKSITLSLRNRYRPIKPLGQGGFGKTYLALDEDRLNANCVIKQFSPQAQGTKSMKKAVELFNQEAVRLYELGEHSQIPTLLAYFEQETYLYLVQQYIEGQSLAQEVGRNGPFSEQQIWDVLFDLLPVLHFIHQRQVIHRDITPMNILRRKSDDRLVLIDFGVSKQFNLNLATQPGTRIGTEGYSPLEQFRGGRAYPASDIYSLGATCIHLLTNAKPDSLYNPLDGRWIWRDYLQKQGRRTSDRLALVLDTMLKDLVNERYQTAEEVYRDLPAPPNGGRGNAQGAMAVLPPDGQPLRRSSPPQNPSRPPISGRAAQSSSGSGRPTSGRPTSSGRSVSGNRVGGGSAPPSSGANSARSRPPTSGSSGSSGSKRPSFRLPVSGSNTATCRCLYTLEAHTSWVTCVAAHPVTPTFASSGLDDTIKVWNLRTGDLLLTLTGHTKAVNAIAFSPNGKVLVSGSDDFSIKIWDALSGELISTLTGHGRDVTALTVSADGQFLLSGGEDRAVRVWQMATGRLVKTPVGAASIIKAIAASPDGQLFASGGMDKRIALWSMKTAELVRDWVGHAAAINAVAIGPQSQLLASAGKDRVIKLWSLESGQLVRELQGHGRDVNAIAFTPNGKRLISGSSDKTVRLWDIATGRLLETLNDHLDSVNSVAIAPDGKWFVSGGSDKTVRVWQLKAIS